MGNLRRGFYKVFGKAAVTGNVDDALEEKGWPLMGGFLLSAGVLLLESQASRSGTGVTPGADCLGWASLLALLWSAGDIIRGARARDAGSIMWGGLGLIVGFLSLLDSTYARCWCACAA